MKILFMCVANAARSQMAEGLARDILGPSAEVHSAGSKPKSVHPLAKKVLAEIGIDISSHFSKSISQLPEDLSKDLNYLITLCADEVCPVTNFKTAQKLHWPMPDPANQSASEQDQIVTFRRTRDEIAKHIRAFTQCLK